NRAASAVEVRLIDGKTAHDGRVEVRTNNGQWSTVCNSQWDILDAYVVCRMLNYLKAVSAGTTNVKGSLSGPIYPKRLYCHGYETSIEQCRQVSAFCVNSGNSVVVCGNNLTSEEKAINVRLVGTKVSHVGQVEIQYNGTWGAVCGYYGNSWDIRDAHVICRMLGYKAAERPIWYIEGETSTRILMDQVGCSGKEQSIAECAHWGWWNARFVSTCWYKSFPGVVCQVDEDPPPVQVRLAGGRSPNSGRVEVRYHGAWGTVCNYGWDTNDAEVVCRMLGYTGVQKYSTSDFNSTKGIIWLWNLGCTGGEMSIANCSHDGWGSTECYHSSDVGVVCNMSLLHKQPLVKHQQSYSSTVVCGPSWTFTSNNTTTNHSCNNGSSTSNNTTTIHSCNNGISTSNNTTSNSSCNNGYATGLWGRVPVYQRYNETSQYYSKDKAITVRLVGTNVSHVGQVEIQYNGIWGSICQWGWGIEDAHVICRMLGYKAAEKPIRKIEGETATRKLMDWVECIDPPPVQVRLAGGRSPNSGRVEVRYHGAWGTVCNNGWDTNDADVVCRMLGYTGVQKYRTSDFNPVKGIIWFRYLACTGTEMSIADCSHGGWGDPGCVHSEDVGVTCKMGEL
ncbi:hypothetical protein QZH41_019021, partial [Actinostola sp. cb2023]